MNVARVLEAFGDRVARRTESGAQVRCPAHDDRKASLAIGTGDDGRVLVHCHAGCATDDVLSAVGLAVADLMPSHLAARPSATGTPRDSEAQRHGGRGRIVATYDYRDEGGNVLFQVVRYEPKDFKQRRPNGQDWTWKVRGVRRVLYRLPELLSAEADAPVFVVEGERDADALAGLGLVATTNVGGAGKWRREYGETLRGRHVVILPDNDAPGAQHGANVAASLADVAASVRICELPGLPDKGDVSDWLANGGAVAELLAMAEAPARESGAGDDGATIPAEPPEPRDVLDNGSPVPPTAARGTIVSLAPSTWPDPVPLPEGLPEVPAFDERLLPDVLRPWLSDVTERTQSPPEYTAVGALVALSAIVGRGCAIRPKRQDDWTVVPNLWGAVIGPPSSMKSPALTEALRPIRLLAVEAAREYERRRAGHAAVVAEAKARQDVTKEAMKKAAKAGADMAALRAEFTAAGDPPKPTERRYIVNDATVEKLGELLNENPRGLLHFRDELPGWLATLDRDGHENDRAFFLEAWNGTGAYTYDRIGRGTLHIGAACVSLLGGIQPGPLAQYLRSAVRGGIGDDGLMQRFQLLVYPEPPKHWRNVDRWPNRDARDRAFEVFRNLDALSRDSLGGDLTDDGLPFLRFDDAAQAFVDQWREGLMNRLRAGTEHAAIEAHLNKYPSLLPSLALLFHLTDATGIPPGRVPLVSAQRAAAWCDLLEAHARRVYGSVTAQALNAARALHTKLRAGALPPKFSSRDVYRHGWAGLADPDVVAEALDVLEDHGWVRHTTTTDTGGRPRTEYVAHPSLGASAVREAAR